MYSKIISELERLYASFDSTKLQLVDAIRDCEEEKYLPKSVMAD